MPLRLLDLYTPRPTNDTISALFYSSDPDLGRVPAYWVLKNKVLSAVFTDAQFETINKAVVADSEVRFVTSDAASLRKQIAREWCAVVRPFYSSSRLSCGHQPDIAFPAPTFCLAQPNEPNDRLTWLFVRKGKRRTIYVLHVFPSRW
ncbi:hypothetical protein FRC16_002777 [Serendipita sp. 398]|nr:hypothetical protein FRC16_002777 [Serendipita sp. 398]